MTAKPILAVTLAALLAVPANSRSIIDTWPPMAFDRDSGCELNISGNAQAFNIVATGMIPGEAVRFRLSNGDLKPIDRGVLANRDGALSQLYLPASSNRSSGHVTVSLEAATCTLSASAPWRREIRVIP